MIRHIFLLSILLISSLDAQCLRYGLRVGKIGFPDFVEFPYGTYYQLNQFTLEAWVRPASNNQANAVIAGSLWESDNEQSGMGLQMISPTEVALSVTPLQSRPSYAIESDKWTHVAGTFDGENLRLYLNGVMVAMSAVAQTTINYRQDLPFYVGYNPSTSVSFEGFVDELRLWDSARTAEDIQASYQQSFDTVQPGLVLGVNFDEWEGNIAADIVSGNNGQIQAPLDYAHIPTCRVNQPVGSCTLRCTPGQSPDSLPALPDLILDSAALKRSEEVQVRNFQADSCAINEGCTLGPGDRKLYRFDSSIANIGTADLVLGAPVENDELFVYDACHRHYHFDSFAEYTVFDAQGNLVAKGYKRAYCLMDSGRTDLYTGDMSLAPQDQVHTCNYQGISVGWQDTYPKNIDCQWVDVTDLPDGTYHLLTYLNVPDANGQRMIEEMDYANNVQVVEFSLGGGCLAGALQQETSEYVWEDPATHTALTGATDDGFLSAQLPFNFTYFCSDYSNVYISSNGMIYFTDPSDAAPSAQAYAAPDSCFGSNTLCVLWDDFNPETGGQITTATLGTAPAREFVVSWVGIPHYYAPDETATFQAVLSEEGWLRYSYLDTDMGYFSNGAYSNVGLVSTPGGGASETDLISSLAANVASMSSYVYRPAFGGGDPPVAVLTAPVEAFVGHPITLDASASFDPDDANAVLEYNLVVGDGTEPYRDAVSMHTYMRPGSFVVSLFVVETGQVVLTSETVTMVVNVSLPCPAAPHFVAEALQSQFVDPVQEGHTEAVVGTNGWFTMDMPFSFPMFCNSYMTLDVAVTGVIAPTFTSVTDITPPAVGTSSPSNVLAVLWDTWELGSAGKMYHGVEGGSSDRRVVVTWMDVTHSTAGGQVTFQAVLYQLGDLQFFFQQTDLPVPAHTAGGSAIVGVYASQALGAAENVMWSEREATATSGSAVSWTIQDEGATTNMSPNQTTNACGDGVCSGAEDTCSCSVDCIGVPVQPCRCAVRTWFEADYPYTYNWVDPGSAADALSILPGDGSVSQGIPFTLPFTFSYFCGEYTKIYVNPNGFISFNEASKDNPPFNWLDLISAFWGYYTPATTTRDTMFARTDYGGPDGMQRAIFTWLRIPYWDAANVDEDVLSFQVVLYENGDVLVNLQDTKEYVGTLGVVGKEEDAGLVPLITSQSQPEYSVFFRKL